MNWSIKKKLLAGFMTVSLLTLALGIYAVTRMSALDADTVDIGTNWMEAQGYLGKIVAKINQFRSTEFKYTLQTVAADRAASEKEFQDVRTEIESNIKEYEKTITDNEERGLYEKFTPAYKAYLDLHENFMTLVKDGKTKDAQAILIGKSAATVKEARGAVETLLKYQTNGGEEALKRSSSKYQFTKWLVLAIIFIVLLVSIVIGLFISTAISRALIKAVEVAKELSRGILSDELEVKSSDETGQLTEAMNEMTGYLKEMADVSDKIAVGDLTAEVEPKSERDVFGNAFKKMILGLRDSIGQIRGGSNEVASASSQIAAASDQSKSSAQTLASSSEEITATIHEMAASIRQVSQNAQTQSAAAVETSSTITEMVASLQSIAQSTRQLSGLTSDASQIAKTGQSTLGKAGENMRQISSSVESAGQTIGSLGQRAESIGKIVETIDDIADQTNLLALNAAIEAARAGEHGLGFAVVADEVRKLAERSARSTKEIGELIEAIQRESRAAVEQMNQSNKIVGDYMADTSVKDSLESIIKSVEQIATFTNEIEAATNEQSAGAEQVAKATQDLTRLTQEISAATEEQSTGTAEVVRAMEQLRDVVQQAAEMAEGLQNSAEQLYRQSDVLQGVVGKFKTEKESGELVQMDVMPFVPDASVIRLNGHHHPAN